MTMRNRPDHINVDPPRGSGVSHFTEAMTSPVPEITDEERDLVCTQVDRLGLWSTDIPAMLGLVEA